MRHAGTTDRRVTLRVSLTAGTPAAARRSRHPAPRTTAWTATGRSLLQIAARGLGAPERQLAGDGLLSSTAISWPASPGAGRQNGTRMVPRVSSLMPAPASASRLL